MTSRTAVHQSGAAGSTAATAGPRWQRVVRVLTWAYLAIVLLAVLWPSGTDVIAVKSAAGPWFLSPEGKDIVLNLGMLVPLTALGTLGWPGSRWWQWALAGCALGAAAETVQWALPALHRRGWWVNAVENGSGAWLGAAIGLWLRRRFPRTADAARLGPLGRQR